jgi:hypothetical protein
VSSTRPWRLERGLSGERVTRRERGKRQLERVFGERHLEHSLRLLRTLRPDRDQKSTCSHQGDVRGERRD